MKISSIIDVITNSSTEVYVICNKNGINKVKELLKEILLIANDPREVGEVFSITALRGESACADCYEMEYDGDWDSLTEKDKNRLAEKFHKNLGYDHNHGGPFIEAGLKISTKDPTYYGLVEKLKGIEDYFPHIPIGG